MVFLYSSSDSLTQKKEGIERLGSSTSPVIMADEESYTFDSLSKMMVFDLREICKKEELPSSGNKAELIVRILGHFSSDNDNEDLFIEEDSSESFPQKSKIEGKEEAVRSSKDMDDAIDRLLSRVQTKDNPEIEDNSVEKDITDKSKIVKEIDININNNLNINFFYDEKWHIGVVGIIAGRLMRINNRPSFVMTQSNDLVVGSGRSQGEKNIGLLMMQATEKGILIKG